MGLFINEAATRCTDFGQVAVKKRVCLEAGISATTCEVNKCETGGDRTVQRVN